MLQNGIFDLISQSGPVGKMVLAILVIASIFSWALIFSKLRLLKKASWENTEFLNVFWNSRSMDEVLIKSERFDRSPVARIFKNGARELKKLSDSSQGDPKSMDNVGRALSRSANSEIADLERNVSWLATTASATPFIGLFGTVWGIMTSFQSIGASGAANLAIVAPGISEALITTAMGIAAAVPAVIAYNHILVKIKRIAIDMDCFAQDFLNIVHRRAPNQPGTSGKAGT